MLTAQALHVYLAVRPFEFNVGIGLQSPKQSLLWPDSDGWHSCHCICRPIPHTSQDIRWEGQIVIKSQQWGQIQIQWILGQWECHPPTFSESGAGCSALEKWHWHHYVGEDW